jgi:hypothetical protein
MYKILIRGSVNIFRMQKGTLVEFGFEKLLYSLVGGCYR